MPPLEVGFLFYILVGGVVVADEVTQGTGVDEQGIAPAPAEGVPADTSIALEPEKPFNLSDSPEFRQYQSNVDKEKAGAQRREAALQQQVNEQRAATQQVQGRFEQAEIDGQPNDYGKVSVQLQHEQARSQQLRGELEQRDRSLADYGQREQTEQARKQYIADHVTKFKNQHGHDMPEALFAGADTPSEVEAITMTFLREAQETRSRQQASDEREAAGTDNVDVGVGTPASPESDLSERQRRAAENFDFGSALDVAVEKADRARV